MRPSGQNKIQKGSLQELRHLQEAPAPEKAPQVVAGGSKATSPTETTHQGERDLKTALGIIECIHALHLQILHEMGGMRELEQAAVHTLMPGYNRS